MSNRTRCPIAWHVLVATSAVLSCTFLAAASQVAANPIQTAWLDQRQSIGSHNNDHTGAKPSTRLTVGSTYPTLASAIAQRGWPELNTVEDRSDATTPHYTASRGGAQIVSTDYPDSAPVSWSGSRVGLPTNDEVHYNPIVAPPDCVSRLIEPGKADAFHLQRIILVMRHGIRSPLNGQIPRDATLPGGWPLWKTPPGDLTPHGIAGMHANGRAARQWLAKTGLLSPKACPTRKQIAFHANSAARTIASAIAFADGLAPGCPITTNHLPEGTPDPMFSPLDAAPERFNMREIVSRLPDPNSLIRPGSQPLQLLATLVQCADKTCSALTDESSITPSSTNHGLTLSGPIQDGASISEALMLAYLEGKPEPQFNRKSLDAQTLGTLSTLHAAMLDSTTRPIAIAEPLSRNLRTQLVTDLTQTAGPVFLLYMGHDDTIGPLLGLLNAHILAPGYAPDEIPVGSALGFALYTNSGGTHRVRVFFQSQSPEALRRAPETATPSISFPRVPACDSARGLCTLHTLSRLFSPTVSLSVRKKRTKLQ